MRLIDTRSPLRKELSGRLLRLAAEVIVRIDPSKVSESEKNPTIVGHVIALCDTDPKIGEREHLQLNFEPTWLDAAFKSQWYERYGTHLYSGLLENTEWKRYAWGVWEE